MASSDDSNTDLVPVKRLAGSELTTIVHRDAVREGVGDVDKVEFFLRRLMPVLDQRAAPLANALIPWACDVLQSSKSLEVYGQDIRDFLSQMQQTFRVEPLQVTADHVKLYKAALRAEGLASATIARKLSVLRGVYRQFAAKKLVDWETAQDICGVSSPRVQKNTTPALTEQQAVRLLHAPDTSTLKGLRDHALLHTFFITACRVSAITHACLGHLEFDGTEWFLNVTEKRGRKQRKILLEAARSIRSYIEAAAIGEDIEGPLFRRFSADGTTLERAPLRRETVWRLVRKYCTSVGIPAARLGSRGIGVHSLRKTALNNAIVNGAQLHECRELAGHADIRTTELYFVRRDEDAERAARRIAIR